MSDPKEKDKMTSLLDWVHNSVRGRNLEIVKITDLNNTVLGLKDSEGSEVFILGNLHDLTFVLEGNSNR